MSEKAALANVEKTVGNERSGIIDFGLGVWEGAIENPVNGVVQIVNRATSAELPELHVAEKGQVSGSRTAGQIVGSAIDMYFLSKTVGGLGGAGIGGSALRMGAMGGVYLGVLQPTDSKSATFWKDRLTNAAVGAVSFAGMGASAGVLDATGSFAVPAARSLAGSIAYGTISGAGGGFVAAEAKAVIKDHKLLPTKDELVASVGGGALFGAVFGAGGYAYNRLTQAPPQTFQAGSESIKVWSDRSGTPVRLESMHTEYSRPSPYVTATRMSNGTWSSRAYDVTGNPSSMPITDVTRAANGAVTITGPRNFYELQPNGNYTAKVNYKGLDMVYNNEVVRVYEPDGRLGMIHRAGSDGFNTGSANIQHGVGNEVLELRLASQGGPTMNFKRMTGDGLFESAGKNLYEFSSNRATGQWRGKISVMPGKPGGYEYLQFEPVGGTPFTFDHKTSTKAISDLVTNK